jgi:uncharacterized protein YjbI with pentapeptide repeats
MQTDRDFRIPWTFWQKLVFFLSLLGILLLAIGWGSRSSALVMIGCIVAFASSVPLLLRALWLDFVAILNRQQRIQLVAIFALIFGIVSLGDLLGWNRGITSWLRATFSQALELGSLADWFGAFGQIFIAVLAVYIAWQQYVISRDLTIEQNRLTNQQNILTQQQTIDTYFQGISDLALDDEGFLEDWPQEQAFAEGRTAALLGSIDAGGKAKVLRFLSQAKLLTPLRRDRKLGRPILNGNGGYEEDRLHGCRVIDLGVMLAGSDLARTDLRWTDLSEANFIRTDLSGADLVKANLSRTILFQAKLTEADLKGTRFFYGKAETASPRSRVDLPNYSNGSHTGAVVEGADFSDAKELSPEQRYYICAWCGEKCRRNVPGGCDGIPNKLGY